MPYEFKVGMEHKIPDIFFASGKQIIQTQNISVFFEKLFA
jgi:hypothetical protein